LSKSEPKSKETYQYSEETIEIQRSPTKTVKTVQLTYWTDTKPPRTIWIPAQGYDDKARAKAIAEDQKKLAEVKTGTVEI
jgi:hypothetical protein